MTLKKIFSCFAGNNQVEIPSKLTQGRLPAAKGIIFQRNEIPASNFPSK
jgi:hypothetical protein